MFQGYVSQRFQGMLAALHLFKGDQLSLPVHLQHRLDAQHAADQGGSTAEAAAAVKMIEIIHREPVGKVQFIFFNKGGSFFKAHALFFLHGSVIDKQSFTH